MTLYELRAQWAEYYDCPDNGQTKICDTYETIAFAVDNPAPLNAIRDELITGYRGKYWSLAECNRLRRLYPGFDDHRETTYEVHEVSHLIIPQTTKE